MKKLEDVMKVSNEIENISVDNAKKKLDDPNVQFVDVRDKESFEKLISEFENNKSPMPGSRLGRFSSEPEKMTKKYSRKKISIENASIERFRG